MSTTAFLKPTLTQDQQYLLTDKMGNLYNCIRETPEDSVLFVKVNLQRGNAVRVTEKNGQLVYRACAMSLYDSSSSEIDFVELKSTLVGNTAIDTSNISQEKKDELQFLNNCFSLKPKKLKMKPLTWKYLTRSVLRAKNIMMAGPTGCGKTFAVQSIAVAFPDRKLFTFNIGSTQDPHAALIGNTHFSKESGTYFAESAFVKAIQTENAIILLDELSRAHPEAMNILMSVLDEGQRYIRLDEADNTPIIKVANGVCFIATANIGNEYTATRVLDRALLDRFVIIEMETLGVSEEKALLSEIYPELSKKKIAAIAEIADGTRNEVRSDAAKISTMISTRHTIEVAGLMNDGFTLAEAADVAIFPFYPVDGGIDSERTFVKQLVQRFLDVDKEEELFTATKENTKSATEAGASSFSTLSNEKPF